ncbi:MAG: hypothetical protein LQ348_006687, partial [Seirophora lacunosa]
MVREDLISSAVRRNHRLRHGLILTAAAGFLYGHSCLAGRVSDRLYNNLTWFLTVLQDPSVTNSPLDKRIAFLRSKNLTQEEIDAALARAGDSSSPPPPPPPPPQSYGYPTQQMTRQPNGYGYGYGPYPNGPWSQPL